MTNEILASGSTRLRPGLRPFRRALGAAAVIGLSAVASAMQPAAAHERGSPSSPAGASPLVEKVRHATPGTRTSMSRSAKVGSRPRRA